MLMSSEVRTTVGLADHSDQDKCLVRLAQTEYGSLDAAKLERLRELLAYQAGRPDPRPLLLDLSSVQYFGAGFVGVLVDTWHLLSQRGRRLALRGLTPYCARLIRVMHLEKIFDVEYPSESALDGPAEPGAWREKPVRPGSVRVRLSEVAWNPEMVREEFIGDDGEPIRAVIRPRERTAGAR
jgi:anti-anti-sigma factor